MKVKDLIQALADHPEAEVILSRDSEGNGFSPLAVADPGSMYRAESTWSGEVKMRPELLTKERRSTGYSEEDTATGPGWVDAVVLWPTN